MLYAHWHDFVQAFIPLFIAIDIAGLLPIYLSLTRNLSDAERQRVTSQAILTSCGISLLFMALGAWMFRWLGISSGDFQIAGGILLLVFAITEILQRGPRDLPAASEVGVVPLGTPLIVGPAVLTSLLILTPKYGYRTTLLALLANLTLVALGLIFSRSFARWLHENTLRAISQVINLLLAAIAVSLIRKALALP